MTYPEKLNKLISYIPAEVYAEHEKQITELADAIVADRARLKEAVLNGQWYVDANEFHPERCYHCERPQYHSSYGDTHAPDCIVRQLDEEGE